MTDLSPAARAVLEAAVNISEHMPYEYAIAAALRAAVDQTFPDERDIETELIRSDLLAIAEALARWGRQPAPHDDRGVLPMVISDTGASDEPERERIICSSISGGADYINNMPRMLILERIELHKGSICRRYIQEPTPPAEGEVAELVVFLTPSREQAGAISFDAFIKLRRAAELLQQQRPTPVPVSERLPEPGDCDAEGRCWAWNPEAIWWELFPVKFLVLNAGDPYTHWLPAHALPLPQEEVQP